MKRREYLKLGASAAATATTASLAGCSDPEEQGVEEPPELEGLSDSDNGVYVEVDHFDTSGSENCKARLDATVANEGDEEVSGDLVVKLLSENGQERGSFETSYESLEPGREYDMTDLENDECYPFLSEEEGYGITDIDVEFTSE